ncbi:NAD/NADP octopine/nopaline dehydrogenase family protein [Gammaproteobacteria bacterium]|nr:NAD/NADP octopine/nopaline dehydrogenase family protein [Gammaproteobacteria bacterium]
MIRICVIGAGSIGRAVAAILGAQVGLDVHLWARKFEQKHELRLVAYVGSLPYAAGRVTAQPDLIEAVDGAAALFLTTPSHTRRSLLERCGRFLQECHLLFSWEGSGSFAQTLVELGLEGIPAAGYQRSPLICRGAANGIEHVEILAVRSLVTAASIAKEHRVSVQGWLQTLLPFRQQFAPDYRYVSISPGNPLIHPARLFSLYRQNCKLRAGALGFYQHWDDDASEVLLQLHTELSQLRDRLALDKRYISTYMDRDTVPGPQTITAEIRRQAPLAHVRIPVVGDSEALELDFSHRFFAEDIGEGIRQILKIADASAIRLPALQAVAAWYESRQA